jgi:membrane protein implicated in regulation of membrane protease activity
MFQLPLGILGQIYAVCALIGCTFVLGSFALGMVDDGQGDAGSDAGDSGDGGDTGDGVDTGSGTDAGGDNVGAQQSLSASRVLSPSIARSGLKSAGASVGQFFLGLLSPMSVAMFSAFFGLGGLLAAYLAPGLGIFTLVGALVTAWIGTGIIKSFVRWMFRHMHSSSSAGNDDIIGQTGEVNIAIQNNHPGEVIYVVKSKRYSSAARSMDTKLDLKKGEKVVIMDIKDHMVYVEPCDL